MLIQEYNQYAQKEYTEITFSPEQEERICRSISGDSIVKLELVKTCIELIIKLARWYSVENSVPFPQLVQIGIHAVVKGAEDFCNSGDAGFVDYLCGEVMRAMIKYSRPYSSN